LINSIIFVYVFGEGTTLVYTTPISRSSIAQASIRLTNWTRQKKQIPSAEKVALTWLKFC